MSVAATGAGTAPVPESPADPEADPDRARRRRRLVPLVVASALFMENLDATIIATALPAMAASFGTTPTALSLGITVYMLALGVFIPVSGWAADRWGTRTVFAWAIAGFVAASVLCGISQDLWFFIFARILQGAAAAMMSPVGRLVVLRGTPKSELFNAITWITWPSLVAPVVGPALGGFFVGHLSWHWIFFVNVPIGLAGIVLVLRFVPNIRGGDRVFDWIGLALTAATLACLLFALDVLGHGGASWSLAAALLVVGAALGHLAVRHSARSPHPLVGLGPFLIDSFRIAALTGGGFFRLTAGAMPFVLPLFFQLGFGMTALDAGLMVLAYAAGNLGMKSITRPTIRRFGFRPTILVNGVAVGATILACAFLEPGTPTAATILVLFVAGSLRSLQLTGLQTLTYVDVPPPLQSSATTIASMLQPILGSVGVAICAVTLSLGAELRGAETLGIADFRIVLAGLALTAALSVLPFLRLPADVGDDVAGHRRRA
jgi:EmrB/QacA subfamily drug resistance transporter